MTLKLLGDLHTKGHLSLLKSDGFYKLTATLHEPVDDGLCEGLEQIGDVSVVGRDGMAIRRQDRGVIGEGFQLSLIVPRDRNDFVGKDFDDLLHDPQNCIEEPKCWLLLEQTSDGRLLSSWMDNPPNKLLRYRDAQQLCRLLQQRADHEAEGSFPIRLTYFEIERLDMDLIYKCGDLSHEFPIARLKQFIEEESQKLIREESFKGTLWDYLKNEDVNTRISRLLRSGDEFERRVRANHALARQDLRLNKRLEEVRKEITDFSSVISKLIFGLEAKALAIPGAMILAAKVIDPKEAWSLGNLSVICALILVALILSVSLWTQLKISTDLKYDIDTAQSRFDVIDSDGKIHLKLERLKNRINIALLGKVIVVIVAWVMCYTAYKFIP